MKTVIFIPVSRDEHLDRLFHSLEVLECDVTQTTLLTYVDGDAQLFVKTRNFTEMSKFAQRLCVQRPAGQPAIPGLHDRRRRISVIKNESKALMPACDYVFGIEDDTIVPPDALQRLLDDYISYPFAGFIEGVELGRWGIPYVGAWHADDVYEPTHISSLMPTWDVHDGIGRIEEIDAGGFYCYITRYEHYMAQEYAPFGDNDLGPDVNWGLNLRKDGYKNYIDWSVNCEHRLRGGTGISLGMTQPREAGMILIDDQWKQEIA